MPCARLAFKYAFVGFFVGAGGAFFSPLIGVIPVTSYTYVASSWVIPAFMKADNENYFNNLHFNAGYRESARRKNAINAALGSATGLIVTATLLQLFSSKLPDITL